MKKVLTIGRDPSCCEIVIYDSTDMVSRSHATLRVDGKKYYITDHSTNGTYRNGIKLTPFVEYSVTRDDEICFGGVSYLDWSVISDRKRNLTPLYIALATALSCILVALVVWMCVTLCRTKKAPQQEIPPQEMPSAKPDSSSIKETPKDTLKVEAPKQQSKQVTPSAKSKDSSKKNAPSSKTSRRGYSDSDDTGAVDAL